jgi:HlyD family secretion protein
MAKKVLIPVVTILIIAGAYLVWTFLNVTSVSYITMEESEAVETLLVSGRVVGEGAVPLSFKRSGQLTEILVSEGDPVQIGDLIARLDDRDANNLVTQSENNLNSTEIALSRLQNRELPQAREALVQAESRADIAESLYESAIAERLNPAIKTLEQTEKDETEARRYYEDQKKLYDNGLIDISTLEMAENEWNFTLELLELARDEKERIAREVDNLARERDIALSQQRAAQSVLQSLENEGLRQARLNVSQARTQLDKARLELEQTRLEAPFTGVISTVSASKGQFVTVGQEICIIIPTAGSTFIEAQVDEEFAGKVSVGQEIVVNSTAFPDRLFYGKVERISPTVDPNRGTFQVRFILDRFESDLLPDLAVSAEVVTGRTPNSLILEQGFTFRESGRLYVLVENRGVVEQREVFVEDLGRGLLLVTGGLTKGEKVLVDLELEEGQRIRLGDEVTRD